MHGCHVHFCLQSIMASSFYSVLIWVSWSTYKCVLQGSDNENNIFLIFKQRSLHAMYFITSYTKYLIDILSILELSDG